VHEIPPWLQHNAPTFVLLALWVGGYWLRRPRPPKRIARPNKPVTLHIAITADTVTTTRGDMTERSKRLIAIRGPKVQVLAIGNNARNSANEQRVADERVVEVQKSDLWQFLRAWPAPRKPVVAAPAKEIVIFDPFALETFSLTAIDAYQRYEVAVVTQGISLKERWYLRRGVVTLAFADFDRLTSEQQSAVVRMLAQHVPVVAVNDTHFFSS